MLFVVQTRPTTLYTPEQQMALLYSAARRKILLYPKKTNEKLLDRYIKEQYNSRLIFVCLKILSNATFSLNNKNEIIITVVDKRLAKLASLITYGTGKVPGSNILKFAFSNQ